MLDSIVLSASELTRLLIALQYITLCPLLWLWLVRRLPHAIRLLAGGALALQAFLVVMGLLYEPPSAFERWLVHLDSEWNIPSIFGSTQLALVGFAALLNGWLARWRRAWQRVYLLGMGFLFLSLGLHDYFQQTSYLAYMNEWYVPYAVFASLLLVVTVIYIETSPKQPRLWLLYIFSALFMLALGGVIFDGLVRVCHEFLGIVRIDGCISRVYLEETLELIGGWVALVAMLGHLADDASTSLKRATFLLALVAPVWILLLLFSSAIPRVAVQARSNHAAIVWDSGPGLHAYGIGVGDSYLSIRLHLSPSDREFDRLGYSVHLVEIQNGSVLAKIDRYAQQDLDFHIGPGYAPVFRQWVKMQLPPNIPTQTALGVMLSLWREDGGAFVPLKITSSDHKTAGETHVVLREIVLRDPDAGSPGDVYAQFANGFTLDPVEMPARAQAGGEISIPFTWRAAEADGEEYVQFMHFFHEDTGEWWVWDSQPLGARLPTRLWYGGLVETETWQVPLSETLKPGRYAVFTGLYRVADLERLPAKRADGRPFVDARLPLGVLTVETADL